MSRTQFYVITVVKLRFFIINLRLGGSRSKSSRGPDPAGLDNRLTDNRDFVSPARRPRSIPSVFRYSAS
jgi:hypothetical protein